MSSIDGTPQWMLDLETFNAKGGPPIIKPNTRTEPLHIYTIENGKSLADPSSPKTIEHMMMRIFRMYCKFVTYKDPLTRKKTVHNKDSADGHPLKAESWDNIYFELWPSDYLIEFEWEFEIEKDQDGRMSVLIPDFVNFPYKTYVRNYAGINSDKRGSNNMNLQTEHLYEKMVSFTPGIWSFTTLCQRLWRLKSHFFENNYETFFSSKVTIYKATPERDPYILVDLIFDHGS